MCSEAEPLVELVTRLNFDQVDDDTAMGEFHGLPAAMTVLSFAPPAFMFQIRLNRVDDDSTESPEIDPLLSDTEVSMSIENGCAYLSVYDMTSFDDGEVLNIMDKLAESLLSSGQATKGVCLRCANARSAELMYIERRPTRLCVECLEQAAQEREEKERQLNPRSHSASLRLPVVGLVTACTWAVFWILMDMILDYWNIDVIEVNAFVMLLILVFLGIVGWAMGWPAGKVLRRSSLGQWAPRTTGIILAGVSIALGEVLYIAMALWRVAGIFDPLQALLIVIPVTLDYSGFWITCKLILVSALTITCCLSVSERRTVSLDI